MGKHELLATAGITRPSLFFMGLFIQQTILADNHRVILEKIYDMLFAYSKI